MIMKKIPFVKILIAAAIYFLMAILASTSGLIHPVCFAYSGTVLAFLWSFVYLYVAANMQCFGAAAILNGTVLIVAVLMGEGDAPLFTGMIVFAALAEIIRRVNGYDTLKGVRLSYIPLAFSFYAYTAHWWTDTEGSLQAAVEEMRPGYDELMKPVIANIPALIIALMLVIPLAILGMRAAEKIMKKQAEKLH